MRPLTKETIEMTRQGLLSSDWCGFSKRDTVNQLCDLALKGLTSASEKPAINEGPILNASLNTWFASDQGQKCNDGATLVPGKYLKHRLEAAYIAGWDAHKEATK